MRATARLLVFVALQWSCVHGFQNNRALARVRVHKVLAVPGETDDEAMMIGRTFRVVGVKYREGKHANLKVYGEAGDPYSEVLSLLRHGDEIVCTGFRNFAGQTWVQHTVDEAARGLYKGTEPKPPYVGWSPQDLSGSRWLVPLDVRKVSNLEVDSPDMSEMLGSMPPAYDNQNLFAKIVRGEIPSYKVFETEHALAILDAFPIARFHCLLLPKAASVDISDLGPQEAAAFLQELPRLVAAVRRASGAPAVKVVSNAGLEAGQEVFHTHFHVVPRFSQGDPMVSAPEIVDPGAAAETLEILKEALD